MASLILRPPALTFLSRPPPPPPPLCSYNKQVLKAFPYPLTITALQFAIGSLWCCVMWLLRLHKRPEGNFIENVSCGQSWLCSTACVTSSLLSVPLLLALAPLHTRTSRQH